MKPIKVLQVFTILNRGGAETSLMNYYRNIDKAKIHFDFLVHREEQGAFEGEIRNMGGKIFRLPPLHPLKLKSYKAAVKKFFDDHEGYQIIHGQSSELGIYIYQEAKSRNVPVIIAHAHSSKMNFDLKAIFRLKWKSEMLKYINTYFSCGLDSAYYLFGKKLAQKSYQINNAVDCEKFRFNQVSRTAMKIELGATNNYNIAHIGSFNKIKNHVFIIKIFSEFVKIQPSSQLFLIGEGLLKSKIETLVVKLKLTNKVIFMGSRNDVPDVLQAMDLFLLPSYYEGLPLSLIEAQTSGILSVISDRIPHESVLLPENVLVLSLNDSAAAWVKQIIIKQKGFTRIDQSMKIKNLGYDINTNAVKLEQKYIELVKHFS